MKSIEEQIKEGTIIADGNANVPGTPFYRGIFVKGNFLLYRFVEKNGRYRGGNYRTDGYVLAWADMVGEQIAIPPAFVPLRGESLSPIIDADQHQRDHQPPPQPFQRLPALITPWGYTGTVPGKRSVKNDEKHEKTRYSID